MKDITVGELLKTKETSIKDVPLTRLEKFYFSKTSTFLYAIYFAVLIAYIYF